MILHNKQPLTAAAAMSLSLDRQIISDVTQQPTNSSCNILSLSSRRDDTNTAAPPHSVLVASKQACKSTKKQQMKWITWKTSLVFKNCTHQYDCPPGQVICNINCRHHINVVDQTVNCPHDAKQPETFPLSLSPQLSVCNSDLKSFINDHK